MAVPEAILAIRQAARGKSALSSPGTIRAYYPFWDVQYRPMLVRAVEQLPPDRFDYKPVPSVLTARQLVLHIAEAERGWMENIVGGGEYLELVTPHEDPAQGWVSAYDAPDHAALLHLLEVWHRPTQRWFDAPESELGRLIHWRGDAGAERTATLHWVLDHVQEHELHHRAQLNLYLRMMGLEPPGP